MLYNYRLRTTMEKKRQSKKDEIWLEELDQYIQENLNNESLTADKLALLMDISKRQLFRKIKALTNQTLVEYINEHRFQKAKHYLENYTYRTVAQTALAVGFRDASYFSRQYKERFGILPSEV